MIIEVNNAQKIALLEFLDKKVIDGLSFVDYVGICLKKFPINENNLRFFNVDTNILSEALDKIEQVHKTITTIKYLYIVEEGKYGYQVTMTDTEMNTIRELAFIRNEALLKAIIAYLEKLFNKKLFNS